MLICGRGLRLRTLRSTIHQGNVDELMTLRDVSRAYKRPSYWTWLRMTQSGDLPTVRLPSSASKKGRLGRILVRRSDVERLLDQCREGAD